MGKSFMLTNICEYRRMSHMQSLLFKFMKLYASELVNVFINSIETINPKLKGKFFMHLWV